MSVSSRSDRKPKWKKLALVLGAIGFVFWLIFRIDRNPEITYNSTDGKVMVLELEQRLQESESLDNIYLPIDQAGSLPAIPIALMTITVVHCDRAKSPYILRWLAQLLHISVKKTHLSFSRKVYSPFAVETFEESSSRHFQGVLSYSGQRSIKNVKADVAALKNLSPNAHLRLHSDFMMILVNNKVRVYLLDSLPQNIKEMNTPTLMNDAL